MTPNRDQADLIERLEAAEYAVTYDEDAHIKVGDYDLCAEAAIALASSATRIAELLAADEQRARDISRLTVERDEARDRLATSDTRITELEAAVDVQRASKEYAQRCCVQAESRLATTESALDEARGALRRCNWYWPEEDTSSETCAESAQEVVQNAYDWSSKMAGKVVSVARGGIVEVTYCASLPPADDADSDDDFWVQGSSEAVAVAKIEAELARRASLTRTDGGEDAQ